MSALDAQIDTYFSNLNPVFSKIYKECENFKESHGLDRWNSLSPHEQETLLDGYLIDPSIANSYINISEEEKAECFPTHSIHSGEKIVVDFDHDDGWTWQDEHSGPFSWKTKSQQDLTLAELDELANEPKEESKRQRVLRRSRSPERPDMNSSSGYDGRNEVEQIFQKFGITYHNKDDESNDEEIEEVPEEHIDNSKPTSVLSAPVADLENQNYIFEDHDEEQQGHSIDSASISREGSISQSEISFGGYHGREMVDRTFSSSERSSSTISNNSRKVKKSNKVVNDKKWKKGGSRDAPEAEKSLIDDLSIDMDSFTVKTEEDIGQVSPVFIEDPGESSTDKVGTTYRFPFPKEDSSHGTEINQPPTPEHFVKQAEHIPVAMNLDTQTGESDEDVPKTGFDFLDNW